MTNVVAIGSTTTYTGGWTYSDATGPLLDPTSDVGFPEAVADMFNLTVPPGGATAAAGGFFGSLISLIGNAVQITINYILDIGIPYTPPTFCLGPRIDNGVGGSCEGNIPCSGDINDLALKIDQIPNVGIGFKKCMKGRMGCGGSHHRRIRISCSDVNNCGPCSYTTAAGCNLGGSQLWYCGSTTQTCNCSGVIFHEMSHACGALDDRSCPGDTSCSNLQPPDQFQGACRLGYWFEDQCCNPNGLSAP